MTQTQSWQIDYPEQAGETGVADLSYPVGDVRRYGVVGDGVTDDTVAMQSWADSADLSGGSLFLKKPTAHYRITDTIKFGQYSLSGQQPLGFTGGKAGIRIIGDNGWDSGLTNEALIKWDGGLQTGNNASTYNDGTGNYTFIDNDKGVFEFTGCRAVTIENISIDGNDEAHQCILFDGNHTNINIKNSRLLGSRIGLRNTKGVRHDTYATYYGYAGSPYFIANVYDVPTFGGYQADTYVLDNVNINSCETGISIESQQALSIVANALLVNGSNSVTNWIGKYGMLNRGGRVTLNGAGFVGNLSDSALFHLAGNSTIIANDLHDESGATYTYKGAATAGNRGRLILTGGDCNDIYFVSGEGHLSLRDVKWNGDFVKGTDASATYPLIIDINNCRCTTGSTNVIPLGAVTNKENVILNASGVELDTAKLTSSWGLFTGTVAGITPAPIYDRFEGTPNRDQWWKDKTADGSVWSDGKVLHFSGEKTAIADEIPTAFVKFDISSSNSFYVVIEAQIENGSSSSKFVVGETIAFAYTTDNGGNTTLSTVNSVSSVNALDTHASSIATFTIAESAGYVELSVNQNNETSDTAAAITYSGKIMGGFNGGNISVDRVEFV